MNARCETIHHMGRRCLTWDYSSRCIYAITLTLADRSRPWLGRLVGAGEAAVVEPSAYGRAVIDCWAKISAFWPMVSALDCQLMGEHFHGALFVKEELPLKKGGTRRNTLGDIIRGFKAGCSMAWREIASAGETGRIRPDAERGRVSPGLERGCVLPGAIPAWSEGYVDEIIWRRGQLEREIAYFRDNPRRLWEKRAHPELFRVLRDLEVDLAARNGAEYCQARNGAEYGQARNGASQAWNGAEYGQAQNGASQARRRIGHFSAIGNHNLLKRPLLAQVQCSRSLFEYRRERLVSGKWRILRDSEGVPLVAKTTPEFEEKAEALLALARKGAVLISPCISHGENEIARRAFAVGCRVIRLQNKGFSPLYKPGGRLFDQCAAGNLLMLAPVNWPYVPGEKPPTRESSLVLNRIAQLIAGAGAAEIDYKGATIENVDELVAAAVNLAEYGQVQNGAEYGQVQNGAEYGQARNGAGGGYCSASYSKPEGV